MSGRLVTQPTVGGLLSTFADHADRTAVVFGDRRATYQQLDERSRQIAAGLLDLVATRPARIGLLFPNDDRFVTTFLGITRIGAVAVPISTFSTAQELRQLIVRARLDAVIVTDRYLNHDYLGALDDGWSERDRPAVVCWPEGAETPPGWAADTDWSKVEALERALDPGDAALVVHTSGSTSRPKAVLHDHPGLMRSAGRGAHERGFDDHSCVWTPMPFFWVGGLCTVMLAALSVGGRVVRSPSNEPSTILDLLEREQATHVMAWPHSAKALRDDPTYPGRDLRRQVRTPPGRPLWWTSIWRDRTAFRHPAWKSRSSTSKPDATWHPARSGRSSCAATHWRSDWTTAPRAHRSEATDGWTLETSDRSSRDICSSTGAPTIESRPKAPTSPRSRSKLPFGPSTASPLRTSQVSTWKAPRSSVR